MTNQVPFVNSSWNSAVNLAKDQTAAEPHATVYMGDDQFLTTLGLKLVAGRNFTPDEYIEWATLRCTRQQGHDSRR